MANIPEDLHYSKDHEWIRLEGGIGTIGITDHAQHSLGDVVYVELPKVGDKLEAHEAFGSVESVKAVSEIFMPVAGEITEVNETLQDKPEHVNNNPYTDAWMVKVRVSDLSAIDAMLNAAEYEDYTKSLQE